MVLSQSAFLILVSSLRNGRMPLPSNRTAAISRERNDCHLARWAIRLGIRIVHSNLLRGSELTSSNLGESEATMAAAILGSVTLHKLCDERSCRLMRQVDALADARLEAAPSKRRVNQTSRSSSRVEAEMDAVAREVAAREEAARAGAARVEMARAGATRAEAASAAHQEDFDVPKVERCVEEIRPLWPRQTPEPVPVPVVIAAFATALPPEWLLGASATLHDIPIVLIGLVRPRRSPASLARTC